MSADATCYSQVSAMEMICCEGMLFDGNLREQTEADFFLHGCISPVLTDA
jgi:hypothetical protein